MTMEFRDICENAQRVLGVYSGEFIERVSHLAGKESWCQISLRKGNGKEEVLVTLEQIRYLAISDPLELDGFVTVEDVSVTYLPTGGEAWPETARRFVHGFPGLPALVWIRITGPVELDVVASIITVSAAVDLAAGG
ncbi:hypothetical protein OG272_29460 [Streptomyces sp. NBC_00104]|uniref:hypothetical protein n=1 Tax=unclassified Streptomyces TaxID=2593676 RepID=UPI003251070D